MQHIRFAKLSLLFGLAFWCSSPALADGPLKCKSAEECMTKGQNLVDGRGVKFDPDEGIRYLEAACAMNDAIACYTAAQSHERFAISGDGKLDLYEQSCSLGLVEGCNNAVVLLSQRTDEPALYKRAASIYEVLCDREIGIGCRNLAVAHYNGLGVEKSESLAEELLQKACDLGDCPMGVATNYMPGTVRPVAVKRAQQLEESCVSSNRSDACEEAARIYMTGNGVTEDDEKGIEILHSACNRGQITMCWKLGQMLMHGRNVDVDAARSLSILMSACDAEHAFSCADTAQLLQNYPELADASEAPGAYLQRACDLGDSYACERIAESAPSGSE